HGLPPIQDLRGRFTDAMDAYTWQYEELWPRTTHRMLVALPPRQGQFFGGLRDYAVANRAMVYWLDPTDPVERGMYERILATVEPTTSFLGWFPQGGTGEWSGVELLSEHGVITFAADRFENMTVFSAPCCHELPDPPETPAPPLGDRIYVTFTFSDGDNLAYDQHTMRALWGDPARGRVPMNWTISPALWDAAPAILRYYRETAAENDLLIAGPSGLGYVYPTPWPDETFHLFTELTGRYMDRTGIDIAWTFNMVNGQPVEISRADAQAYGDDVDPLGMMLMYHPRGVEIIGGVPWSSTIGVSSVAEAEERIAERSAWWDHESPMFLSVYMIAWETSPSDVVQIADSLGPDYVVVRADRYFELIREAQPAQPTPAFGVTASRSSEGSPPELAIDGDPSTAWNAGEFAPQWIEVDLGSPSSVERISLLTAQSPKGQTVHRVLGSAGRGDPYRVLHEFTGVTADGRWLTYAPPKPWEDVRSLRVETTQSPSWVAWREIVTELEEGTDTRAG
ncbi:MAG TPA: discoidin domain-containing protein, partial [Actinomycetota bacterium]|nr:discoidin domain-containing protein [Actinomycetota bacterium]